MSTADNDLAKIGNRILISVLTLLLAFVATQVFMNLMMYQIASWCGYEAKFGYNEVMVPMDYHLWTRQQVLLVNLLPPLICLLLSVWIFLTMVNQKAPWERLQLPAYWLMICLANIFFSHLLFSLLGVADNESQFYQTIARAAVWMYVPVALAVLFPAVAAIGSIMAGFMIATQTVKLTHTRKLAQSNSGKNRIILQFYILPFILSIVPLMLLTNGASSLRMSIVIFNLSLFPLGMFFRNSLSPYHVEFQKANIGTKFPAIQLVLCTAAMLIVYLFFK